MYISITILTVKDYGITAPKTRYLTIIDTSKKDTFQGKNAFRGPSSYHLKKTLTSGSNNEPNLSNGSIPTLRLLSLKSNDNIDALSPHITRLINSPSPRPAIRSFTLTDLKPNKLRDSKSSSDRSQKTSLPSLELGTIQKMNSHESISSKMNSARDLSNPSPRQKANKEISVKKLGKITSDSDRYYLKLLNTPIDPQDMDSPYYQNLIKEKEKIERAIILSETKREKDSYFHEHPQNEDGKALTRYVEQKVLEGKLPITSLYFFHPERKGLTPRDFEIMQRVGTWNELNHERQKNRPLCDSIPDWLTQNEEYRNKAMVGRSGSSRKPIFDIVSKSENERADFEIQALVRWLEPLDHFNSFPSSVLHEAATKLKGKRLDSREILCRKGDVADCIYIVYMGELQILVENDLLKGYFKEGMVIGLKGVTDHTETNHLTKTTYRTATLRASRETYLLILYYNDYRETTEGLDDVSISRKQTEKIIMTHPFFRNLPEQRSLAFMNRATFKKWIRNDVIYDAGQPPNGIHLFISGKATREIPINVQKANRWPASSHTWEIHTKSLNYIVSFALEAGDIFGVHEILKNIPRRDKIIVSETSFIASLSKEDFDKIFDVGDLHEFEKFDMEAESKREWKLRDLLEEQQKIQKIKYDAVVNGYLSARAKKGEFLFRNENGFIEKWKKTEKEIYKERTKEKRFINIDKANTNNTITDKFPKNYSSRAFAQFSYSSK